MIKYNHHKRKYRPYYITAKTYCIKNHVFLDKMLDFISKYVL